MQGWMIALIIIACAVAILAIAFIVGALVAVHAILGRRKEFTDRQKAKKGYDARSFGVNVAWFDGVKDVTETLKLTAYDGVELCAYLIKQRESKGRAAICCHGYGANPRSMQAQAKIFYDRGFDVLLPAMRGHCESGGKVGMAWIDRFDLLRWIDKIISRFGQNVSIALCGVSMGGATVVAAAGMNPPSQVKCVIDDCGFSSQYDEYRACLGRVPLPASVALLPLAVGVRIVHGYSIADADITKLAKNITLPALFIHGEKDRFVPFELGKKLFDACGSSDKRLVAVPNAAHACSYVVDPAAYVEAFTEFVDKNIRGSAFEFDSDELLPERPSDAQEAPTVEADNAADENPRSDAQQPEAQARPDDALTDESDDGASA